MCQFFIFYYCLRNELKQPFIHKSMIPKTTFAMHALILLAAIGCFIFHYRSLLTFGYYSTGFYQPLKMGSQKV